MHCDLIRVTEETLPMLVDIGQELMSLAHYKEPYDRKWTEGIARTCMNYDRYFGRLALVEGRCCGLIVGSVCSFMFSPAVMAVEETIYVRERTPFRASIARQLLAEFEQWAFVEKKASFIRAGETSEICPVAVDRFFRSQGYKRAGTLYKKESS